MDWSIGGTDGDKEICVCEGQHLTILYRQFKHRVTCAISQKIWQRTEVKKYFIANKIKRWQVVQTRVPQSHFSENLRVLLHTGGPGVPSAPPQPKHSRQVTAKLTGQTRVRVRLTAAWRPRSWTGRSSWRLPLQSALENSQRSTYNCPLPLVKTQQTHTNQFSSATYAVHVSPSKWEPKRLQLTAK